MKALREEGRLIAELDRLLDDIALRIELHFDVRAIGHHHLLRRRGGELRHDGVSAVVASVEWLSGRGDEDGTARGNGRR